jgi:hypothetical protein
MTCLKVSDLWRCSFSILKIGSGLDEIEFYSLSDSWSSSKYSS